MVDYIPHILVVDDDKKIRILLQQYLREKDYYVSIAKDAAEAKLLINEFKFDLLIVDVMMPGETGIVLTKSLRSLSNVPIIMLTAMAEIKDKIAGLESGADDYLVKPFEPKELLLRIENILKRTNLKKHNKEVMKFGQILFDVNKNILMNGNKIVKLTSSEQKLFRFLVNKIGVVVTREALARECRVNERSIDVQVIRIRHKIEQEPKKPIFLQTVRGKGYILYEN